MFTIACSLLIGLGLGLGLGLDLMSDCAHVFVLLSTVTVTLPVAGPMEWNSLPDCLRVPARSTDSIRSALKTHLFAALMAE